MQLPSMNRVSGYWRNEPTSWPFITIFILLTLNLGYKFYTEKHLSLDGVNYFFQILESRDFSDIAWSRRFTEYLTEWPLVLAVQYGITDIPVLVDIFSIGIYFPYLLSFSLCLYAVRDENKSLLWFPLAGYLSFNIISDYDLIADHHVMAVMTWPILLILLKSRQLLLIEGLILWFLVILYSRMYETAVLTACLLCLIAVIRIFLFTGHKEKIILGIAVLLFIVVMIVGVTYIIKPRSPANLGSFLDSIWVNKRNWEALATGGFIAIFSLGWVTSEHWVRGRAFLFYAALLPIGYYAFLRGTTDYAMTAYMSFSSRTLSGIILPGLILLSAVVTYKKRALNNIAISSFFLAFLIMGGFNLADMRYWSDVKEEYQVVINSNVRYVFIEDTPLKDNQYRWSWNNSLLSLVWSYPCVTSIILNTEGDPQGPVNPTEKLVLKRYLKYDRYFTGVDPGITVCDV